MKNSRDKKIKVWSSELGVRRKEKIEESFESEILNMEYCPIF